MVKWSLPAKTDLKRRHEYLIYEVAPGGIEILGVIHGKRNFFSKITETQGPVQHSHP